MQVHKSESLSEDIQIPKHIFDTIEKNIHLESASAQPVYLFQHIFVFRKGNQVYLSHLYLTDTNYTSLKCSTKNELTKEN
jgi:hypothetical protein